MGVQNLFCAAVQNEFCTPIVLFLKIFDFQLATKRCRVMIFQNLNQSFLHSFTAHAPKPALMFKKEGHYCAQTYRELGDVCISVAKGLLRSGFQPGDRAVILSNSRPGWAWADLGALLAGGITSAIYTQSLPPEIAYILNDLEAKFLFIEDEAQLEKIVQIKDRLPSLQAAFIFAEVPQPLPEWVQPFSRLIETGREAHYEIEAAVYALAEKISEKNLACIIYTSGTTGAPKGVALTHGNYLHTMQSVVRHIPDHEKLQLHFSFLPLAHSFERLSGHYLVFYMGRCAAYAESMETIAENLREVRPNILTAVPRFFEKVYARIVQGVQAASPLRRKMFQWALAVGRRVNEAKRLSRSLSLKESLHYRLADRLVYRKARAAFGGRLEFCISGGAPLSPQIARFFYDLGILILEGWGATEATAPLTINKPEEFRFGSVGKPIPGVRIRVAEDGELEVKGPNIFKEYWKKPEDTQESFTPDGYYKTGDIGMVDGEGWVFITDRKKQLIITAGGKNIAPAPIQQLLAEQPHIEMAYVHGDRRKYLTALLLPDEAAVAASAARLGLGDIPSQQLKAHPAIEAIFREEVDRANAQLPRYMQIKFFRIAPERFTVEGGELTHTQKLRKNAIEEKYRDLLESMYPPEAG